MSSYHIIAFSFWFPDNATFEGSKLNLKSTVGWSMLLFILTNVIINIVIISKIFVNLAKSMWVARKKRMDVLKQAEALNEKKKESIEVRIKNTNDS